MIGVSSKKINEYIRNLTPYIEKKAKNLLSSVEWFYDTLKLYCCMPSSSQVGKKYIVIVLKGGEVERACQCVANRQGRPCWHMVATYFIWRKASSMSEEMCGAGLDYIKYTGREAVKYFEDVLRHSWGLEETKEVIEEVRVKGKVDLSGLSSTLSVLEEFIGGLVG